MEGSASESERPGRPDPQRAEAEDRECCARDNVLEKLAAETDRSSAKNSLENANEQRSTNEQSDGNKELERQLTLARLKIESYEVQLDILPQEVEFIRQGYKDVKEDIAWLNVRDLAIENTLHEVRLSRSFPLRSLASTEMKVLTAAQQLPLGFARMLRRRQLYGHFCLFCLIYAYLTSLRLVAGEADLRQASRLDGFR
ncbi:hypothetical protein BC567DRAFT_283174 [Phyllosticta citribraziliensis]